MRTRPILLAAGFALLLTSVASAQRGPQTQKMAGKLKEIQQKGRATTLIVTDEEGKEHEFPLTPRVEFEVTAPGDEGFVRPGMFVSAQGVLTNQMIFVRNLNVYLIEKGQRQPPGKVEKAARQAGQSTNTYDLSGTIVMRQASPDYPDFQLLNLKVAGQSPPVMLEKSFNVTVIGMNPELVKDKEGAPVELEVSPLRGDRLNLVKATVKLSEKLDSATYFGESATDN